MTIPFDELLRYEVDNDEDYYALVQLYDERDDCYEDLIRNVPSEDTEWVDRVEFIITEIDDVERRITNIRKKYSGLVKKFN
jgi:hypothetical protein